MLYFVRVLLVLLVMVLALAQPGLCPCWLAAEATGWHPHPAGLAQHPHDHDYLNDLFQAEAAAAGPVAALPASLWLLAAAGAGLLLSRRAATLQLPLAWQPVLDPPPPRLLAV
jgi:hypothetical protein